MRAIWEQNQGLLKNAGSLLASTGVTSGCGFLYWIFAARYFSQQSVGYASAAFSVMTLLGTIGMFGLGTMLIGKLPQRTARGGLIMASLAVATLGSLVLGIGFAVGALPFGSHYPEVNGTVIRVAIFALGVALTGATQVLDEATIGLLRGGVQLARNTAFSVAKMAILPAVALVMHDAFGVGIELSWIVGMIISLVPVMMLFKRGGGRVMHPPGWAELRSLAKVAMAHNWLNLVISVPPRLMPVLVATLVSPQDNAAYYVASMVTGLVFMVPTHLSTVLFAVASATPEAIGEKLRFVLRLSFLVGLAVIVVLGVGAHLILSVFGAGYASAATVPMWLLLLGYLPAIPTLQYIAVCRATSQLSKATRVLAFQAVIQVAGVIVGARVDGLVGVCLGLLAAGILAGIMTSPLVFRAAGGRLQLEVKSRSAEADSSAAWTPVTAEPAARPGSDDYWRRQDAGIAALVAIATSVTPQSRAYGIITDSFPAIREQDDTTQSQPQQQAPTGRHHRRGTGALARVTGSFRALDITRVDLTGSSSRSASSRAMSPGGTDEDAYQVRQEAALAALLALSTRNTQY